MAQRLLQLLPGRQPDPRGVHRRDAPLRRGNVQRTELLQLLSGLYLVKQLVRPRQSVGVLVPRHPQVQHFHYRHAGQHAARQRNSERQGAMDGRSLYDACAVLLAAGQALRRRPDHQGGVGRRPRLLVRPSRHVQRVREVHHRGLPRGARIPGQFLPVDGRSGRQQRDARHGLRDHVRSGAVRC